VDPYRLQHLIMVAVINAAKQTSVDDETSKKREETVK
jgi:hypothetical protein